MKKHFLRLFAVVTTASFLLLSAVPAQAHESRTEGGVEAVVGWATEPAYVGFPNAVQLRLNQGEAPLSDLGPDELKVEVTFGGEKTSPLPLEPAFGSPGEYRAPLIPTRGGEYSFRFFGTIKGQPYDQTFTSGEETFDSPRSPADVSFPAKDPTVGELAARVEELDGGGQGAGAGSSNNTGRAAMGIAVAALALAIVAFVRKGRAA